MKLTRLQIAAQLLQDLLVAAIVLYCILLMMDVVLNGYVAILFPLHQFGIGLLWGMCLWSLGWLVIRYRQ